MEVADRDRSSGQLRREEASVSPRAGRMLKNSTDWIMKLPPLGSVGGKALNLAILTQAGVPVPPWRVLTVEDCEKLLSPVISKIDHLVARCDGELTPLEASREIKRLIDAVEIDQATEAMILGEARLIGEGREVGFLAVRSSAIDEDSEQNSFAGQLDTYLFQRPDNTLLASIKGTLASAFSERALVYRLSQGLSLNRVRTAVIIQEMIFGDVSGVAFTANPLNGNPEESVIEALYGTGEGVVSGELDCDSWIFDSNGALIKEAIRDKESMVDFDHEAGGGTKKAPVSAEKRKAPSLKPSNIRALLELCRKIEREVHGGRPQDIEWCFKGDELFILQARPITAFSQLRKNGKYIVFDNSDLVESYAGVPTPLTFSFASASFKESFKGVFVRLRMPKWRLKELETLLTNLLGLVHGRMYYNLLNWHRYLLETPIGGDPVREYDQLIGITPGNYPVFPDRERRAKWPHSLLRVVMGLGMRYKIASIGRVARDFERYFYRHNGKYVNELFRTQQNAVLAEIYREVFEHGSPYWDGEIVNFIGAQRAFAELEALLRKIGVHEVASVQSVINDLISGDGEIASLRPTKAMMEIADKVRADEFLRERFLEGSLAELKEAILDSGDPRFNDVARSINEFLEEYGCRCMNELKLEEPTLREDPSFVFATIRAYVMKKPQSFEHQLESQVKLREKAEKLVCARAGIWARLRIRQVVARVRKHVYYREELRLVRGKYWGIIRRLFYAMGRNFAADKVIENWKDIFMLKVDEIMELVEGRSPDVDHIRELIVLRYQTRERQLARPAVSRIYSYGDVSSRRFAYGTLLESSSEGLIDAADEIPGHMSGIPCGPGVAKGKARVALTGEDALDLDGEILVAERTDPGWIPLYPSISGLVIERGSVLSHSAVVAREMGIPTVVGIVGATQKIRTGDELIVDGSAGKIQMVKIDHP